MGQTLDALSTIDANGSPVLGNCTLVVGDGTVKVEFVNGRAQVPVEHAALINQHPHVEIPALDAAQVQIAAEVATPALAPATADTAVAVADVKASEDVQAAIEHLQEEGLPVPEVAKVKLPDGTLEPLTADGLARCQAAKGDGSQCSNPSQDGSSACGLAAHQAQVA